MKVLKSIVAGSVLAWGIIGGSTGAAIAGHTVDQVRQRGVLVCGTNPVAGYASRTEDGRWSGFMIDFCRAVAAAVLGDADRIDVVAVESQNRFEALFSGRVDLLTEGTTWTLRRDAALPAEFPAIYLYDGQGFLAHKDLNARTLAEAGGASICAITETTSISNAQAYIRRHKLPLKLLPVQSDLGGWSSFLKRRCDIFTNDMSGLQARRALHSPNPDDYVFLAEVISKEPLSPVVRADDTQWSQLVRWVVLAMIAAEEKGLCLGDPEIHPADSDAEARTLLGQADDHGAALGLEPGWARRVLKQVGCYGDVFERHLGSGSPLKAARGLNRLWRDGGLLYAPPFE